MEEQKILQSRQHTENNLTCVCPCSANLSTLSEYCIPYIRVGGMFVSYKSGTVEDELKQSEKAVSLLGGKIEKTVKFQLPDTEIGTFFCENKKDF